MTEAANGRKALVLREEQVSQTVGGRPWARTVQTKAQWPGQRLVKIQNESHILTFQVRAPTCMRACVTPQSRPDQLGRRWTRRCD